MISGLQPDAFAAPPRAQKEKWEWQDLNLRPRPSRSRALSICATFPNCEWIANKKPAAKSGSGLEFQRKRFFGANNSKKGRGKLAMPRDEHDHCNHCVGRSGKSRSRRSWSWSSRRAQQLAPTGENLQLPFQFCQGQISTIFGKLAPNCRKTAKNYRKNFYKCY